jgi:hypothetical protein
MRFKIWVYINKGGNILETARNNIFDAETFYELENFIAKETADNNSCSLNVFGACETFTVWKYLIVHHLELHLKRVQWLS